MARDISECVAITTLVENTVNIGGLRAEHGLSFLIRVGGRKLLFDTGQSDLLLHNAQKMGLALEDVDAIAFSHGHYDHTGGIAAAFQAAPLARLFCHPSALAPKFGANLDGTSRFIGLSPNSIELLRKPERRVTWTTKPTEVLAGIFVTGEIPRANSFEDTGGRFFLDTACTRPDPLIDDQALYFNTANGIVAVLGCAHSGVVNTLNYIRDITHGRPITAVIGGMHLLAAGPERMKLTIEALRRWAPNRLIPAHCTGISAFAQLWAAFPDRCSTCPVGTSSTFPV